MQGPGDGERDDRNDPRDADMTIAVPDEAVVPETIAEMPSPFPLDARDDTFDRERERERERTEIKKRGEYEAFIAHHAVSAWSRAEHFGTVMAADAASIVLHIGRHQYVEVDLPPDTRGADAPRVGDRVFVDRSGKVTRDAAPERERSHGLERRLS